MVTNLISTIGAYIIAAGILLFLFDLARNFRFTAEDEAGNIYCGGTLEWLPTGLYSTRSIPVVKSREPLWDQPKLAEDVEAGRYFLPNTATGKRETLITSPVRAEPQYLQIMPGPSVWPLLAAIFTAGFFILLTIQAYNPSIASGVLALICVVRWLWETDRPVAQEKVDIGAGITVPTYVTGSQTHGWWAMVVLLTVVGMIWLMTVFSFLYLYGVHPEHWKAPPDPAWLLPLLLGYGGTAGLAILSRSLLAREKSTLWTPPTVLLCAAALLTATMLGDWQGWRTFGLAPELSGQGATISAFLVLAGLLTSISVLMTLYIAARTSRGLLTKPRNNSFDLTVIFLVYTAAQAALSAMLVRLIPWVL
jgi:cytochrome c oxidase subunit I+III